MATTKPPLLLYAGIGLLVFALGLSLLAFPLGATHSTPAGDFNGDGTSDGTYSVAYWFEDVDGNSMSILPFELVTNGGAPADSLVVYASWAADGFRVDWTTFAITLEFEIREYGVSYDYEVLHSDSASDIGQTGGVYFFVYSTDLVEVDDGLTHNLNIYVKFIASVTDEKGVVINDEDVVNEGGLTLTIMQPHMNVEGTTTYDANVITSFSAVDLGLDPTQNPAMATLVAGVLIIAVQLYGYRKR